MSKYFMNDSELQELEQLVMLVPKFFTKEPMGLHDIIFVDSSHVECVVKLERR